MSSRDGTVSMQLMMTFLCKRQSVDRKERRGCDNVILNTQSSILETIYLEESAIIASVNKLKPNLSSGPDSLPPLLFISVF